MFATLALVPYVALLSGVALSAPEKHTTNTPRKLGGFVIVNAYDGAELPRTMRPIFQLKLALLPVSSCIQLAGSPPVPPLLSQ